MGGRRSAGRCSTSDYSGRLSRRAQGWESVTARPPSSDRFVQGRPYGVSRYLPLTRISVTDQGEPRAAEHHNRRCSEARQGGLKHAP